MSGHRYAKTLCNLVVSIITNDSKGKEKALDDANHFLQLKNTKYENAPVRSLIAFITNNYEKMSEELEIAVTLYSSNKLLHDFFNDLNEYIAVQLKGLISLAYHHLPGSIFKNISIPEHFSFPYQYYDLNLRSNFTEGNDFLIFDGKLSFVQESINRNR